jgi:hypothetical protein
MDLEQVNQPHPLMSSLSEEELKLLEDLEAPLEGLIHKPMHLKTDAELREEAQKMHEYRINAQALRASMAKSGKVKKEEKDELGELFAEI